MRHWHEETSSVHVLNGRVSEDYEPDAHHDANSKRNVARYDGPFSLGHFGWSLHSLSVVESIGQ